MQNKLASWLAGCSCVGRGIIHKHAIVPLIMTARGPEGPLASSWPIPVHLSTYLTPGCIRGLASSYYWSTTNIYLYLVCKAPQATWPSFPTKTLKPMLLHCKCKLGVEHIFTALEEALQKKVMNLSSQFTKNPDVKITYISIKQS